MKGSYPSAKGATVYTDWLLIRRLAWELNQRFAGARVRDVGQLEDGRFALAIWSRGRTYLIAVDIFAPTPVITLESGDLPVAVEPGFVRATGAALRGMTLLAVRSRKDDRLIRFDFGSRSRFGVQDGYSLICELVPRFGNIVLVKGETIVTAVKEFAPAENAVRSIQAGDAYEPPPLRPGRASTLVSDEVAARLAESVPDGELHVYRRDGALVQVHLIELPQYAHIVHERSSSLLDVLDEARRSHEHAKQSDRITKRRRALERTLSDRRRRLGTELAQVQARLREAANRETLRAQGESIYATLHELEPVARDEAKERAAEVFAKYKKAVASVEHLDRRRAELSEALADLEDLAWELERAGDAELDDVAQAIQALEPRHTAGSRVTARKRKPLQYLTAHGSRIYVGRTPLENADLTFRVARPDDLWFHVQNQPGAHVILQRDDKAQPPENDVLMAASLAALHSKAKNSPKVTVDYTQRKFVRKRPSAAPGLVFYTHPKSVYVEPRDPTP
jgi:predicted ribosome quality control (RQC) complex YloA/Tae2 family protein